MTLVLASGSPRRLSLLQWTGRTPEVVRPDIDESRLPEEAPVAYAERLAATKASVVDTSAVVVAADTVVHRDGVIFDKPRDRDEAVRHLRALSGGWHAVTTGVCVRQGTSSRVFHSTTEVRFRALSDAEIAAYVATGEADDKAGAYGIQGRAGVFVAELRGSWTNVMGLPMEPVLDALAAWSA